MNSFAGDRPFPSRFRLATAVAWAGISIASSLAAWVCFVPLAQAQERQPSVPFPAQIEPSPASSEMAGSQVPSPEPLPLAPALASDAQDSPEQGSIGQIDTQRPALPFSDVPPDHWAYEALLYLSTGGRSPRSVP
ncbi:hypothetical protein [Thermoleptolyngbya sp. C42_A2020_037]|uniref:hypothetical protein n=1 Tax=Thermoleptolyngbya sp. C42_A2020_037 TaxID=2747799 RepID=UPI0019DBD0E9|nr:hypothetical protein [Thermoleptolyngbya sp. C42_A2020_037]MBF2086918.1 hypothetical protein [Thermoleptolyngbya sp. C42_A2020_037]